MPIGYFQGYVSSPASAYRCLTNWQKARQHEKIPNKLPYNVNEHHGHTKFNGNHSLNRLILPLRRSITECLSSNLLCRSLGLHRSFQQYPGSYFPGGVSQAPRKMTPFSLPDSCRAWLLRMNTGLTTPHFNPSPTALVAANAWFSSVHHLLVTPY
jgi:hypothetical protein